MESVSENLFNCSEHIIGILVILTIIYYFAIRKTKQKCIKGKLALVTGGGSGLGAAIALHLAKNGCNIAIADINYEAAKETASQIEKLGVKTKAYRTDVSSLTEIEQTKKEIESDLGTVDIVINNAAILFKRNIDVESPEQIQRMMNVNIMSVIWTTRVFMESMIAQNDGHIVTISSIAGFYGVPSGVLYGTSKFALRGFMESLALEFSHRGINKFIKTTTVYPYFISTNSEVVKEFNEATKQKIPKLMLKPHYVAKKIVQAIKNEEETLVVPGFFKYFGYNW